MCVAPQISQFNLLCNTLLIQWRIQDFTDGCANLNLGPIITANQRSCGKVMFLHQFVCPCPMSFQGGFCLRGGVGVLYWPPVLSGLPVLTFWHKWPSVISGLGLLVLVFWHICRRTPSPPHRALLQAVRNLLECILAWANFPGKLYEIEKKTLTKVRHC